MLFLIYVVMVAAIDMGLYLSGLAPIHGLLSALSFDSTSNVFGGEFYSSFFNSTNGVLTLGAASAIVVVGYIVSQGRESILLAVPTIAIAGWIVGDLVYSLNSIQLGAEFAFIETGIKVLTFLLIAGFILVAIQWWRGIDG